MRRNIGKHSLLFMSIMLLVIFCFATVSFAASKYVADPSLANIIKAGKIRIGTSPGYFPFEMINTKNEIIGFDADIAKYLADGLGVELEMVDYDWNGLVPALLSDKVDVIISGITILGSRAAKMSFSVPYTETGQAIVVNQEKSPGLSNWKELDKKGNKIGVVMGNSGEIAAPDFFKNAEIISYTGATEAGLAVVTGKVNAVFNDQPWTSTWASKNPEVLYPLNELITKEKLGIALKHGKPELLQYINTAITALRGTPKYDQMFDKWFITMDWLKDVKAN